MKLPEAFKITDVLLLVTILGSIIAGAKVLANNQEQIYAQIEVNRTQSQKSIEDNKTEIKKLQREREEMMKILIEIKVTQKHILQKVE